MTAPNSAAFRSVLPHEPLPNENLGYLHIQGAFQPKPHVDKEKKKAEESSIPNSNDYWPSPESLKLALEQSFIRMTEDENKNDSDCQQQTSGIMPNPPCSVHILDHEAPYTKIRLTFDNPQMAKEILISWRNEKISPLHLFQDFVSGKNGEEEKWQWQFSARPLQVTQITTAPLSQPCWSKSNAPKFRRLLLRPGESDITHLQEERSSTRFVFVSGLFSPSTSLEISKNTTPHQIGDAIRKIVDTYDTSGMGMEIFVNPKNLRYCHLGCRSNADVKHIISKLQGKIVKFELDVNYDDGSNNKSTLLLESDKLFLDYADITKRSVQRQTRHSSDGNDAVKGEPSRSECTSTTSDIVIPGLTIVEDFVSQPEEEVLMAVLTGPHAPWAPSQITPSKNGTVKRRVQHYGYVFDYETADVLRDKAQSNNANCPPLPGLGNDDDDGVYDQSPSALDDHIQHLANEGRGWETLAGIIERARRYDFHEHLQQQSETLQQQKQQDEAGTMNVEGSLMETVEKAASSVPSIGLTSSSICFPSLNQCTVNEYQPNQGIGSHVDTETAFGDGIMSVSLNGGIVMEFRKSNDKAKGKKLVYLPPRSLLLMSGDARYKWEHMIVSRMTDTVNGTVLPRKLRVSLTLRTALERVKPNQDNNNISSPVPLKRVESTSFPPRWGSSNDVGSTDDNSTSIATPDTERDHVHAVYDAIATQWHHTRGKRGVLWPGATQFLQLLPKGSLVADVGCGDGKYFPAIWEAGSYVIGSDISFPLLKTALGAPSSGTAVPESRQVNENRRHLANRPSVAVADCMNVPLRTDSCDAAICIAVMHHLSTEARRVRCIEELVRIVKPGGTINIQAWAMKQDEKSKRKFAAPDVFVPFNAQPKYLQEVEKSIAQNDEGGEGKSVAEMYSEAYEGAEFNERNGLVVFKRYCHMYRKGELEALASRVPGTIVSTSGYESGNYFIILEVEKEN